MNQDVASLVLSRKEERPDIYVPVVKPSARKTGLDSSVYEMIADLKSHIPSISLRQVADALGISTFPVRQVFAELSTEDEVPPIKTNEEMCADELGALMATGREGYEDDERADRSEPSLRLVAPIFRDVVRKADQSHLIKRPITLPTFPIIPLRIREAA